MSRIFFAMALIVMISGCNLTVNIEGEGSVHVERASAVEICASNRCEYALNMNESVTLTPTASEGYAFIRWADQCEYEFECSLTLNSAKSATAIFKPIGLEAEMARLEVILELLYQGDYYDFISKNNSYDSDINDTVMDVLPIHLQVDAFIENAVADFRSSYGYVDAHYSAKNGNDIEFCQSIFFDTVRYDTLNPRAESVLKSYWGREVSGRGWTKSTGAPLIFGSTVEAFVKGQVHPDIDLENQANVLVAERINNMIAEYRNDFKSQEELTTYTTANCNTSFDKFELRLHPKLKERFMDAHEDVLHLLGRIDGSALPGIGYEPSALLNLELTETDPVQTMVCFNQEYTADLCVRSLSSGTLMLDITDSGLLQVHLRGLSDDINDSNYYKFLSDLGERAKSELGLEYRVFNNFYDGTAANIPESDPIGVAAGINQNGLSILTLYLWKKGEAQ
ncbi:MAG: hypothetical protein MI976_29175 [Pseudomonadales bacterium]|nr:hypothetical protein [Pseudomonadales bacterium]